MRLRSRRVLLVEDSIDEREMYATWFQLQGYQTLQADSAGDGYRLAVELKPDVAVIDVWLRGTETGLDLTRRLKTNPSTCHMPILVVSGMVYPHDRAEARDAGCSVFLPKPCTPIALTRVVNRVLTHRDAEPAC